MYIDTLGVGTTDFGLSDAMKKKLKESGRKSANAYFKWYDAAKAGDKPANKP